MNKILITGGLGFIGFHLTMELLKDSNNQIVIYDSKKHFIPIIYSQWGYYLYYRIHHLEKNDRVKIIIGDCNNSELFTQTLIDNKPNKIFHLASLPIAGISNDNPEKAKIDIFDNTLYILESIKNSKIYLDNFIYISSSMVYGNFLRDPENKIIPASEDQKCDPIDLYGVMKLNAENLVRTYNHRFKIPFTIVRPSAVYGPTDCNLRVTEIFIQQALASKDIILDNGGDHQLDFTYIDDLVQGLVLVAKSDRVQGETFNLSTGQGISIKELAMIVKKLIPNTSIIEGTIQPYRPNRGALNISKAKNCLGFSPKYTLETGIEKYINFIKSVHNEKI